MIVLDTNILSEILRDRMDAGVESWFQQQTATSLFTTCVTRAELWVGVRSLPDGRRRGRLTDAIHGLLRDFDGRILAFDGDAADHYADIVVSRRALGRPLSQFDGQIAGITRSRGARLATRNTVDFEHCGIELINPFEG